MANHYAEFEDRIKQLELNYATILKHANKGLKELHQLLIEDLDLFRGKVFYNDDITLLSCQVQV